MIFDIRDYGAIADGRTLNTIAIQNAVNDCVAKGGGRVLIEGGTYVCGSISLGDNVELYLAANAVLLGSPNCEDYPERAEMKHVDSEWLPRRQNTAMIIADECKNIAICGQGKIDCNGDNFVYYFSDKGWKYRRIQKPTPPRAMFFTGCKNVLVENITIENLPAGWTCWVHDCDFVRFDKVNITANVDYPNNDGIHINCSRNVTVSNCNIVCGDDCIIVRANSVSLKENKICEKVCVTNCNLTSYSAGIRIGWINDGVIRNCVFSNLVMTDTSVGISCLIPDWVNRENGDTDVGREATRIENLSFDNIVMQGICGAPIRVELGAKEHVKIDVVRNLYFSNIFASGASFIMLQGREGNILENIRFHNCEFVVISDKEIPNIEAHGAICGIFKEPVLRYVRNVKMDGVSFTMEESES